MDDVVSGSFSLVETESTANDVTQLFLKKEGVKLMQFSLNNNKICFVIYFDETV